MELTIDFLDGPPTMLVGAKSRVRVNQPDATGASRSVALERVSFTFHPITWGQILPTQDPAVGLLEVTHVQEDTELLAPAYSLQAHLKAVVNQVPARQQIRILPEAVEVALVFEVGHGDTFRRFGPHELTQPIDWTQARTGDPKTQSLVLRDGRPWLRVKPVTSFPAEVEITFPNGEVANLVLEAAIGARTRDVRRPTHRLSESEILGTNGALSEGESELLRLQRYVASFQGALRGEPNPETVERIRDRIAREVERVRGQLEGSPEPNRAALLERLDELAGQST